MALDDLQRSIDPPTTEVVPPGTTETDLGGVVLRLELGDGSVEYSFGEPEEKTGARKGRAKDHGANIAEELSEQELADLAMRLMEDIEADESSRETWLQQTADSLKLLGLRIESPRSSVDASAPLEGQSVVRHPLLLEAVLRFQANASGELLPADGPVKVRVDDVSSNPPTAQTEMPGIGHNGGPPLDEGGAPLPFMGNAPPVQMQTGQVNPEHNTVDDDYARRLQTYFNHYLTKVATEYYPDTRRMLLWVGFSGSGFKKVYNCPLRRRPVSESVDAKDLIISNTITDIRNASRITHVIQMRESVMRRMQLLGSYRDVNLMEGTDPQQDPVTRSIHEIQGTQAPTTTGRSEKPDRIIYECYCEIDVPGYEHEEDGEISGLPLPWKVTIDKETQTVLEIRRDWKVDDELFMRRKTFVHYPFVLGLGFYGLGLMHIVGNTTVALTAGWREALDNGMFANFPGGLIAKSATRQNNLSIRVAPGELVAVDVGNKNIGDVVSDLPYRDLSTAFMAFLDHLEKTGMRVANTPELAVGDGRQDAPVGTTIAMLDQAQKVTDAVHKGLYTAQAEEFDLLRERMLEDPGALWRFNPRAQVTEEDKAALIAALRNRDLSPAADPNTASHTVRVLRAQALVMLSTLFPQIMDTRKALLAALRSLHISSPEGLLVPPPDPNAAPPDLKAVADLIKAQASLLGSQAKMQKNEVDAFSTKIDAIVKAGEVESKERIAGLNVVGKVATRPYAEDEVARTAQTVGVSKPSRGF